MLRIEYILTFELFWSNSLVQEWVSNTNIQICIWLLLPGVINPILAGLFDYLIYLIPEVSRRLGRPPLWNLLLTRVSLYASKLPLRTLGPLTGWRLRFDALFVPLVAVGLALLWLWLFWILTTATSPRKSILGLFYSCKSIYSLLLKLMVGAGLHGVYHVSVPIDGHDSSIFGTWPEYLIGLVVFETFPARFWARSACILTVFFIFIHFGNVDIIYNFQIL